MGLPSLAELSLIVLPRQTSLLIMGLLLQTKLALMGLLGGTLLSQISSPGWKELVLTTLIMDLLKEIELRTGTIWGNWGKSYKFKLKSVEHTAFVVEVEVVVVVEWIPFK